MSELLTSESKGIDTFTDSFEFETIDKKSIAKINARLPEFHRASKIVGHSTSQSSYSLQSMNMISDSPMARMKQCLSQINKKYSALQETFFKIEKKKLKIQDLQSKNDKYSRLEVRKLESEINLTSTSMESALRQIGMFQDMYDSIREKYNIPENWSEKDYEAQEIEHMIKSAFRITIQDLTMSGRVSRAAVEYFEQLGIHPQLAEKRTRDYLVQTQEIINSGVDVTIQLMYDFLDEMNDEFGECYKLALKRTGLDGIGSEEFMAAGQTRE